MTGGRGRSGELDPETLLVIGVLALLGVAIGGAVLARLRLRVGLPAPAAQLLHAGVRALLLALLASAVLAVLAGGLRAFRTWRTLRSRVAYALLPPPDFAPRPEAIEAFAQQLLGARRRVLAWFDRPACALRVMLTSTPSGRVVYVLELPARLRGSLFNACASAYPGVQLVPLAELEEEAP
jgi:hypothetical protein